MQCDVYNIVVARLEGSALRSKTRNMLLILIGYGQFQIRGRLRQNKRGVASRSIESKLYGFTLSCCRHNAGLGIELPFTYHIEKRVTLYITQSDSALRLEVECQAAHHVLERVVFCRVICTFTFIRINKIHLRDAKTSSGSAGKKVVGLIRIRVNRHWFLCHVRIAAVRIVGGEDDRLVVLEIDGLSGISGFELTCRSTGSDC